jgi:hypothetical protein
VAGRIRSIEISNDLIGSRTCNLLACSIVSEQTTLRLAPSVPGGKVNILGGHSIGNSKQESVYVHVSYSERFPR